MDFGPQRKWKKTKHAGEMFLLLMYRISAEMCDTKNFKFSNRGHTCLWKHLCYLMSPCFIISTFSFSGLNIFISAQPTVLT